MQISCARRRKDCQSFNRSIISCSGRCTSDRNLGAKFQLTRRICQTVWIQIWTRAVWLRHSSSQNKSLRRSKQRIYTLLSCQKTNRENSWIQTAHKPSKSTLRLKHTIIEIVNDPKPRQSPNPQPCKLPCYITTLQVFRSNYPTKKMKVFANRSPAEENSR